jgi:hypothetical protein
LTTWETRLGGLAFLAPVLVRIVLRFDLPVVLVRFPIILGVGMLSAQLPR